MRERLGAFLVRRSIITNGQLETALKHQQRMGGRLGAILISLRYVTPPQLLQVLAEYFNCPAVDLSTYNVEPHLIESVTPEIARGIGALPVREGRDTGGRRVLYVAMRQPDDLLAVDHLAFATNCAIQPMVALDGSLSEAVDYFYQDSATAGLPTFDGRERVLNFEETSPENLEHFYESFSDDPLPGRDLALSLPEDGDDELTLDFAPGIEARTYLKFLIKLLVRKGILTREDVRDLLKT
jgi:hypothetical protein